MVPGFHIVAEATRRWRYSSTRLLSNFSLSSWDISFRRSGPGFPAMGRLNLGSGMESVEVEEDKEGLGVGVGVGLDERGEVLRCLVGGFSAVLSDPVSFGRALGSGIEVLSIGKRERMEGIGGGRPLSSTCGSLRYKLCSASSERF